MVADYEGAIAACTEAIALLPDSIDAYRTRAEAYRRLGKGKQARSDLRHLNDLKWAAELQRLADDKCAVLRDLGIDARMLERAPILEKDDDYHMPRGWIEIDGGPIRWVALGDDPQDPETPWFVPDPRIGPEFPMLAMRAAIQTVRSFPLFGRVIDTVVRWGWCELHHGINKGLSSHVADGLTQETDLSEIIITGGYEYFLVASDPGRGCWTILEDEMQWTRPLWDCHQAIAKALLAIPLPLVSK